METVDVRPAVTSDAHQIARVHVAAWQRAFRGQIPDVVLDSRDEGRRAELVVETLRDGAASLLVATSDGDVVGFVLVVVNADPDVPVGAGEVDALYVDPTHWRLGIGRTLLGAAAYVARERQFESLVLWVLESSTVARSFYEQAGFVADGGRKVVERATYSRVDVRYSRNL